jgi:hypothetical protein
MKLLLLHVVFLSFEFDFNFICCERKEHKRRAVLSAIYKSQQEPQLSFFLTLVAPNLELNPLPWMREIYVKDIIL